MSDEVTLKQAVFELDIETTKRIIEKLIKMDGWKSVLSRMCKYLSKSVGKAWYARNWFLLSILDSVSLIGIDSDVEELLTGMEDEHDYSVLQKRAFEKLTDEASRQLRNGGPTIFFHKDALKRERSSVLLEELVRARLREFIHSSGKVPETKYDWRKLKYTHHGVLTILADENWPPYEVRRIKQEKIGEILGEFGEEVVLKLSAEPYNQLISDRMRELVDALFAVSNGEYWTRRRAAHEDFKRDENSETLKPIIYSGILDSKYLLEAGWEEGSGGWRGLPSSLGHFFHTFSKRNTVPFALVYLLELDHPIVSKVSANIMKQLDPKIEASYVFENMSEKQIEENLDALADFFVTAEWQEGEYGPYAPQGVILASLAIEKKAHLLSKEQRKRMKESTLRYVHMSKWYMEDSVYQANELVLRTQGPDAIDFAKEVLINKFRWETIDIPYFVDGRMAHFLKSNNIDPVPLIAEHVIRDGFDYGRAKVAIEYSPDIAGLIGSELLNHELYSIFTDWVGRRSPGVEDIEYTYQLEEWNTAELVLGDLWKLATLGEVLMDLLGSDGDLTTLNSVLEEVRNMYNREDKSVKTVQKEGTKTYKTFPLRKLAAAVLLVENISEFDTSKLHDQLLNALTHTHVKPRTGAAYFIWLKGTRTAKIQHALEILLKKYKNEIYVEMALKKVKQ
ncbi:MAG: hypothetical protein ACXADC_01200 [Candidatus Thorarchaeota archaeon]|jgi:hypothetical protein